VDVTAEDIDRFKQERRAAGRVPATISRGLEVLRQAYRLAVKKKRLSVGQVPEIEFLAVDNVRAGFFDLAEMTALLPRISDTDVRDFVEWGFRTGQRKSEIAALTWAMLDRSGDIWVLRLPGAITKNKRGRVLGLSGDTRAIMERRIRARRLDCPLIFHRVSKGKAGHPVKGIRARQPRPSRRPMRTSRHSRPRGVSHMHKTGTARLPAGKLSRNQPTT
jgi:integrase